MAKNGFVGLYSGISAAVLRQATYSTTRFAVYDVGKKYMAKNSKNKGDMPFVQKIILAGGSGLIGSFVGKLQLKNNKL